MIGAMTRASTGALQLPGMVFAATVNGGRNQSSARA